MAESGKWLDSEGCGVDNLFNEGIWGLPNFYGQLRLLTLDGSIMS